jgi:hypothetical protein
MENPEIITEKEQKTIKSLFKPSLFSPIFYTIVFGLFFPVGLFSDSDEVGWGIRILQMSIGLIIPTLFWLFYAHQRKEYMGTVKDLNHLFDGVNSPKSQNRNEGDYLTEEQASQFTKQMRMAILFLGLGTLFGSISLVWNFIIKLWLEGTIPMVVLLVLLVSNFGN